jgi:hypothetical protein
MLKQGTIHFGKLYLCRNCPGIPVEVGSLYCVHVKASSPYLLVFHITTAWRKPLQTDLFLLRAGLLSSGSQFHASSVVLFLFRFSASPYRRDELLVSRFDTVGSCSFTHYIAYTRAVHLASRAPTVFFTWFVRLSMSSPKYVGFYSLKRQEYD